MELTGKCKQDFEKWFENNVDIDIQDLSYFSEKIHYFEHGTKSMQYGVLVDFFDSVDISIATVQIRGLEHINISEYNFSVNQYGGFSKTRQEARTKAIEKANEIYNNEK